MPATIRSWTSSRLSAWCAICGSKPAIEASVRTTSSSAVLREFTIQGWSRNRVNTADVVVAAGGAKGAGTARSQAADHRGCACRVRATVAGARL
jgi:predicted Rossmann-fold nucleotide-binding protein